MLSYIFFLQLTWKTVCLHKQKPDQLLLIHCHAFFRMRGYSFFVCQRSHVWNQRKRPLSRPPDCASFLAVYGCRFFVLIPITIRGAQYSRSDLACQILGFRALCFLCCAYRCGLPVENIAGKRAACGPFCLMRAMSHAVASLLLRLA